MVDDTAALTAAKLIGICNTGKVYKLDNSLGVANAYAYSSTCGNLNAHSFSVYARGNGFLSEGWALTNFANIPSTSAYTLIKGENKTPLHVNAGWAIVCAAGQVTYFILPQLEEGAFCTSPIAKLQDGTDPLTSLTCAGTVLSYPTLGKIRSNNMAFRLLVVPRASGQVDTRVFSCALSPGSISLHLLPTSLRFMYNNLTVFSEAVVAYTHLKDIPFEVIGIKSSNYGMIIAVRYYSGSWSEWINGPGVTTVDAKSNYPIGASYQIGSLSSVNQFTGNISELDILFIPDGITDPMAWAKAQWGIA